MKTLYYTLIVTLFSCGTLWSQEWQTNGGNIYNTNAGDVSIGSATLIEPYSGYNSQNNKMIQLHGGSNNYGIPVLGFVKSYHAHNYGGGIIWISNNFGASDRRFAAVTTSLTNGSGSLTFGTRSSSDNPGQFKTMILDGNGNLGIGTTNPGAKLAVNGDIHAKEVRVNLNGWPDFVFNNDYVLPTLDEVEAHIKENGHLKDIPSEAQVKENGINLGEMDAKLLQKIEELTLYIIDLQKQINELKQQTKNK